MIKLYKPNIDELWFKEKMMSDESTMSYNHGTIAFPVSKWDAWYQRWMRDDKRFYRYICDENTFVGEVAYYLDLEREIYIADVIIYAPYRGKGYGHEGLSLLCEYAKNNGIKELYDDIAIDNPSINLFLKHGFKEVLRTDEYVLVKKKL